MSQITIWEKEKALMKGSFNDFFMDSLCKGNPQYIDQIQSFNRDPSVNFWLDFKSLIPFQSQIKINQI